MVEAAREDYFVLREKPRSRSEPNFHCADRLLLTFLGQNLLRWPSELVASLPVVTCHALGG